MGKTGHPIIRILSLILGLFLLGAALSVPICPAAGSNSIAIGITVDAIVPASITDLVVTPGTLVGDIDLAWTTPGVMDGLLN